MALVFFWPIFVGGSGSGVPLASWGILLYIWILLALPHLFDLLSPLPSLERLGVAVILNLVLTFVPVVMILADKSGWVGDSMGVSLAQAILVAACTITASTCVVLLLISRLMRWLASKYHTR